MSAWSRFEALVYDPFLWASERAGMRERRAALLAGARGRVVEIGAGTGLNVVAYPASIDEVVFTEPDDAMRARLERRVRTSPLRARVVAAGAEALPFEDGSVDTVVSTLVLCSVENPERALAEIGRILRPGGRLLFIEHVRAESPRLARWQDRLEAPWRLFADGCHCNRPTAELIRAEGLELDELERATWKRMPPLVRPLAIGRATRVS